MISLREESTLRNWVLGKYAIIDVGRLQTKVTIVKIGKSESVIYDADVYTTPAEIIGISTITNFSEFADFVLEVLRVMEYKGKEVYLISSYLGINSVVRHFPESSVDKLDDVFEKEDGGGRYPSNTRIRSFQYFGMDKTDQDIHMATIVQEADVDLMTALYEAFRKVGLKLLCVSDELTAVMSLLGVTQITYDKPHKIFVSCGNSAYVVPTILGNPKIIDQIPEIDMSQLYDIMGEEFGVEPNTIEQLCYTVGLIESDENSELLHENGIMDTDAFYKYLSEQLQDIVNVINDKTSIMRQDYDIPDDCGLVCIGGLFDIPGVRDYLPQNAQIFVLDDIKENERFELVNKSMTSLSSIFAACLGASMAPYFEHNQNLLPKERFSKSIDSAVINVAKSATFLSLGVACFILAGIGLNLFKLASTDADSSMLQKYSIESAKVETNIERMEEFIQASKATDSYLNSLTQFVDKKSNSLISIASIDTKSLLYVASDSSLEAQQSETSETNISDTLGVSKEDLVIRGYSISTSEIAKLYEELKRFDYVKAASITKMTSEVLPSLEQVYVFEIEVVL